MRKFLYRLVGLIGIAYTGWMWAHFLSGMPNRTTASNAEFAGWAIGSAIGLFVFWLLPIIALWFVAWLIKPKQQPVVVVQHVYHEQPSAPRFGREEAHYDADGRVVPIRKGRQEPYFGRQRR